MNGLFLSVPIIDMHWLLALCFGFIGTAGAVAVGFAMTKPKANSFTKFYMARQAQKSGVVAAIAAPLTNVQHYDLLVCRIAYIRSNPQDLAFVGVFGNWFAFEDVMNGTRP